MRSSKLTHSAGRTDRGDTRFWRLGFHITLCTHRGRDHFATGDNRLARSSSETNPLGIGPSLYGRVLQVSDIQHNEDENSRKQENVGDRPSKGMRKEPVCKPR
jgi:hypothetical protein